MIEFSTTEFCLLCWAILATAKAMEYRMEMRNARLLAIKLLEDVNTYTRISGHFKKQMHEWERNNNQSSREG
jgi:hypothetical protein